MALPAPNSLHRFAPRRSADATAFGYEIVGRVETLDDCIATVQWADCWSPDAAEFILVRTPATFGADDLPRLADAIAAAHLGAKMRLVCSPRSLLEPGLVAELHARRLGFLASTDDRRLVRSLARAGILGVYVQGAPPARFAGDSAGRLRTLVGIAHDLGLRVLAAQSPTQRDAENALGLGFDYASRSDDGFAPGQHRFSWQRRPV